MSTSRLALRRGCVIRHSFFLMEERSAWSGMVGPTSAESSWLHDAAYQGVWMFQRDVDQRQAQHA